MFAQELLGSLRDGTLTLEDLKGLYGISVREYNNPTPEMYVLNYDQINSHSQIFTDVVRVCRQLIISGDFTRILHRSFDRFYNYGEDPNTAEFDISKAICDEKLDGSLIGFYCWNPGALWNFCTRSTAFAEGPLQPNIKNYRNYHDLIYGEIPKYWLKNLHTRANPEYSYIFELTSPYDQHVVRYNETRLTLLAVRNKKTGEYVDREVEANRIEWPWLPKTYRFGSIEEIMESAKNLPNLEEGYVCRIGDWRIKIKNPAHVAVAHLRGNDGLNPKKIFELVRIGEEDEYLQYYPEDREYFEKYIKVREGLPPFFEEKYEKFKNLESQKEFALAIKDIPNNGILFTMRKTGNSAAEVISSLTPQQLEKVYETYLKIF